MVDTRSLITKYNKVLDGGGLLVCVFLILLKKLYTYSQYRSVRPMTNQLNWEFFCYKFIYLVLSNGASSITPFFLHFLNSIQQLPAYNKVGEVSFEQWLLKVLATAPLLQSTNIVPLKSLYAVQAEAPSPWAVKLAQSNPKRASMRMLACLASVKSGVNAIDMLEHGEEICAVSVAPLFSYAPQRSVRGYQPAGTINLLATRSNLLRNGYDQSLTFIRYVGEKSLRGCHKVLKPMFLPASTDLGFWMFEQFYTSRPAARRLFRKRAVRRRRLSRVQKFLKRFKVALFLNYVGLLYKKVASFYVAPTVLLGVNPYLLQRFVKKIKFGLQFFNLRRTIANRYQLAPLRVVSEYSDALKPKYRLKILTKGNVRRNSRGRNLWRGRKTFKRAFSTSVKSFILDEFKSTSGSEIINGEDSVVEHLSSALALDLRREVVGNLAQTTHASTELSQMLRRHYFYGRCALGLSWRVPFGCSWFDRLDTRRSLLASGVSYTLSSSVRVTRALALAQQLFSLPTDNHLNPRFGRYTGGNTIELTNSLFYRPAARWMLLKRRRLVFRKLRLALVSRVRHICWRKDKKTMLMRRFARAFPRLTFWKRSFSSPINYRREFGRRRGHRWAMSASKPLVLRRQPRRKVVRYRFFSTNALREVMFSRKRSPVRAAFLRKRLHIVRISKQLLSRQSKKKRRVPAWFFWLRRRRFHPYWKIFRKRKPQKSRAAKLNVRRQLSQYKTLWYNWALTKLVVSKAALFVNLAHKSSVVAYWYRRTLRRRRGYKGMTKKLRRLYSRIALRLVSSQWLQVAGFKRIGAGEATRLTLYSVFALWANARFRWTGLFHARGVLRFKFGQPRRARKVLQYVGAPLQFTSAYMRINLIK